MAGHTNATEFTHFISIDFGTSGCGIAMATKENKSDIKLFTAWEGINTDAKCPTALLLNPDETFESFGMKALKLYENKRSLPQPEKADDYLFFQKFKMHLYDNPVSVSYRELYLYACVVLMCPVIYYVNIFVSAHVVK